MYGNVDTALRFFEMYRNMSVNKMKLKQCVVDPCVFYKWSDTTPRKLEYVIGCHVDDSIIAGCKSCIDKHMDEFKNI